MHFTFSNAGDVTQVAVTGRITYAELDLNQDPLLTYAADIYGRVVFMDLSGVDYLDSSGVSWLLSCQRRFREASGKLVLHSLHPMVLQVLQVLKLDKVFHLAESAKQAAEEVTA